MDPYSTLQIKTTYTKKELAAFLDQPNISRVREGVFYCKNSNSILFFVDLEKRDKETRFHFDDFFDGEFFHWDSQTTQHINSPKIQEIVNGDLIPHLFARVTPKIKNITQPFVYCGRLAYSTYEKGTERPVHIIFRNLDYDDFTQVDELTDIYLWRPSHIGKSTKTKISMSGVVSQDRKKKYKPPSVTERRGLVTSRVGQGYYRQQIIEKWGGVCAVTGVDKKSILIASHIISWSESSDEERLDVENGILLSPVFDALFDQHLISSEDDGTILISERLSEENIDQLGLKKDIKIAISLGMKKYLKKHRERYEKPRKN